MAKFQTDQTLPFASAAGDKLEVDYLPHYQSWKADPSPTTSGQLLRTVQPVITSAVQAYGGGSKGSPNLNSQARQMALDAFESYDPARGALKTHLMTQLRRLKRVGAQEQNIIRMPEQVALDRQHLNRAEADLRDRLGRDPSDSEVADATGLSLRRLGHIRQAKPAMTSGSVLSPEAEAEGQDIAGRPLGDALGADEWADYVYGDLGNVDQAVMDFTLGMRGKPKLSTNEIAQKLGVTPSAVSQRAAKIQAMLDERQTLGLF